jgi:hypothetical protein
MTHDTMTWSDGSGGIRGAGCPTVNPGCPHRVNELPIGLAIPARDRGVSRFVVGIAGLVGRRGHLGCMIGNPRRREIRFLLWHSEKR